jgi:tRNA wybutosine-synthesizing protein 3
MADSIQDAQRLLNAALTAGFRESGAVGLLPMKNGSTNPIVAVRSNGLGLDTIIGFKGSDDLIYSMVDEAYLRTIFDIANDRFKTNCARIERFRSALMVKPGAGREDPALRRERKKTEGLQRQELLGAQKQSAGIRIQAESHDVTRSNDPHPDALEFEM